VRVGLNLPQYEIDLEDRVERMVEAARTAEDAGFDSVWVSDHPFAVAPDGTVSGSLDALVSMGYVAAATSRIDVGSLVLACSMRSVDEIATGARELALIAPRRIVVGLGAGWYEPEHRAYGVELASSDERVRALEESASAVLGTGVRVLIGGTSPRLLDVVAREADVWNCAWDVSSEAFRALSGKLDGACARLSKPRVISRSVGLTVLLAGDRDEAARAVERVRGRAPFLQGLILEEVERAIIVGDAATCARRIAGYGADEVVITAFVRDDLEMIRRIGETVLPLLRDASV
jgi:alkanesulfonate monooxygenase SsuD/methylene tetrahydromethanopterin reductase-like flavin-dependent oxidoreductase (luciferase family)